MAGCVRLPLPLALIQPLPPYCNLNYLVGGWKADASAESWPRDTGIFWECISAGHRPGCSASATRGQWWSPFSSEALCLMFTSTAETKNLEHTCCTKMTILRDVTAHVPPSYNMPLVDHGPFVCSCLFQLKQMSFWWSWFLPSALVVTSSCCQELLWGCCRQSVTCF